MRSWRRCSRSLPPSGSGSRRARPGRCGASSAWRPPAPSCARRFAAGASPGCRCRRSFPCSCSGRIQALSGLVDRARRAGLGAAALRRCRPCAERNRTRLATGLATDSERGKPVRKQGPRKRTPPSPRPLASSSTRPPTSPACFAPSPAPSGARSSVRAVASHPKAPPSSGCSITPSRPGAAKDRRVPREHRVFERDGWRCTVPGCSSYRNLHDHHIVFRAAGGSDDLGNRTTLCAWHHLRGVHAARVSCRGTAPGGLVFELGLRPGRRAAAALCARRAAQSGRVARCRVCPPMIRIVSRRGSRRRIACEASRLKRPGIMSGPRPRLASASRAT